MTRIRTTAGHWIKGIRTGLSYAAVASAAGITIVSIALLITSLFEGCSG